MEEVFILVLVPRGQEYLSRNIMGQTVDQWVNQALLELPSKRIHVGPGDDILTIVKRHGMHHKWTCVLYSDMPLIMEECIRGAVEFATKGEHKVVRLPRGWLFDTDHVKSGGEITPATLETANPEHFLSVFNASQLDKARRQMQRRINLAHMENGVEIEDIDSTFIDITVQIESTARILPFTKITGDVRIEKGATIGPFAHIRDDGKTILEPEKPEPPKVEEVKVEEIKVEIEEAPPPSPKPSPTRKPTYILTPDPEPEEVEEEVLKDEIIIIDSDGEDFEIEDPTEEVIEEILEESTEAEVEEIIEVIEEQESDDESKVIISEPAQDASTSEEAEGEPEILQEAEEEAPVVDSDEPKIEEEVTADSERVEEEEVEVASDEQDPDEQIIEELLVEDEIIDETPDEFLEEEIDMTTDEGVTVKFDWDNMKHDSLYEGRE
ncbi:MAG: hypothetical protein FWE31_04070 [Firmicutes bacterium]|nr:hypothetical protein [Bacillota bacterium]